MKDFTNIGRDLSKVIMVDDKPFNFCLQKENGITMRPYWETIYKNKNYHFNEFNSHFVKCNKR